MGHKELDMTECPTTSTTRKGSDGQCLCCGRVFFLIFSTRANLYNSKVSLWVYFHLPLWGHLPTFSQGHGANAWPCEAGDGLCSQASPRSGGQTQTFLASKAQLRSVPEPQNLKSATTCF